MARLLAGAVVVGALAAPAHASGEDLDRSFVATAVASGGYATYGIPGFLIVENYIDGGGPVSQAQLASAGEALSFASLPYPGDTAVKYPGIAALFLGSAPPGYPFYASASPNQPEQVVGDPAGPFSLEASAAQKTARGLARTGTPEGKEAGAFVTRAESAVQREGGTVSSRAVSVTQALAIGPLSVGSVRSLSETTYRSGDDSPKTTTSLSVEGGRVGDLTFRWGSDGLAVQDKGVPVPASQGLAVLNTALAPSGLSVRFGEATPVQGGVQAAVFEIVSAADVPGAGKGTLRLRFGGAMSFVSLGAREETTTAPEAEQAGDDGPNYGEVGGAAAGSPTGMTPVSEANSEVPLRGPDQGVGSVTVAAPRLGASMNGQDDARLSAVQLEATPLGPADQPSVDTPASLVSRRVGLGSLGSTRGVALLSSGLAVAGFGMLICLAVTRLRRTKGAVSWMP